MAANVLFSMHQHKASADVTKNQAMKQIITQKKTSPVTQRWVEDQFSKDETQSNNIAVKWSSKAVDIATPEIESVAGYYYDLSLETINS